MGMELDWTGKWISRVVTQRQSERRTQLEIARTATYRRHSDLEIRHHPARFWMNAVEDQP
jgi:hypothetical protein